MRGVLGIDPGLDGACAIFVPAASAEGGMRWQVFDVPTIGTDKRELNVPVLRDWVLRFSPEHAFYENVTPMPSIPDKRTGVRRGMGATSAFRFGGVFYAIRAVVACCGVPMTPVTPQSWKKFHGLKGPDKELSRARAVALFPDQSALLARKMDQNRAEAMLIAAYGAKLFEA